MIRNIIIFFLAVLSLYCNVIFGQNNVSKPKAFNITKEAAPPILKVVPGSIKFIDSNNNGFIDADEKCNISFTIRNEGIGAAVGCLVKITATGSIAGLVMPHTRLSKIEVGEQRDIMCPINANMDIATGKVKFSVAVVEPLGFGTDPFDVSINTKAFVSPFLQIVDHTITNSSSGILEKKKPFDLQLLLQNTRHGLAENVKVNMKLPDGVFMLEGEETQSFATIKGGEAKSLIYSLIVNDNYKSDIIPISISVKERYGKYAENRTVNLLLNQSMSSQQIVVNSIQESNAGNISIAALKSDIDRNIPTSPITNDNTFAIIVANEQYKRVAPVEFAINDGRTVKEYFVKVLGIPSHNISYIENATKTEIDAEIEWLRQATSTFNGDAKILFYYAGHGIPDESERSAYLLLVDGYGTNPKSGYKLNDLYSSLNSIPSKFVTVLIDACFGGAKRQGDMIVSARGASIKVRDGEPLGNMVVFTASQGDETAYSYKEQQHGMFTYFLLKKLKESHGDITLGELGEYIYTNVRQKSIIQNRKLQTPSIIPSATIGDKWKTIMLK